YEAANEVRPLGVGINVQPSAVVELKSVGMLERLREIAVETAAVGYYNRFGQAVWTEPRGLTAGYHVPQFSIHRGDLQMTLHAAAIERLGAGALRTGVEAVGVNADDGMVTLRRRATGEEFTDQAEGVVAADGIHSAIRRQFYPDEGPPRFSGHILWRATSVGKPFLDGRTMIMAGQADQKMVVYPISKRHAQRGESLINWIAELRVPTDAPPRDDWNRQVDRQIFAPRFADWKFDWLDVPALIASAGQVFEFPMVDRDPLPAWNRGRVTLLGDAAHPMYPIGSNGATQAILDARSLCDALVACDDVREALARYESDRLPRTARIVVANRGQGPDHVLEIARQRAPDGFGHIHDVIPQQELETIALGYKKIVGLDMESVNARARALRS
ncbi:MAG: flavin-dependent oxidoreductase, partial [Betaproteobacteria bacterium]|nr:flavin-dependent oxidoreductase [Betaproteobacteria bacterium]